MKMVLLVLPFLICSASFAAGDRTDLVIYYDDIFVVYRTAGTEKNIEGRADFIITVKEPSLHPDPKRLQLVEGVNIDVRITCLFHYTHGRLISVSFGRDGQYMQVNGTVGRIEPALIKSILGYLPIVERKKLSQYFKVMVD